MRQSTSETGVYTGRILSDPEAFQAISAQWQDLHLAAEGNPFSDADWISAWAQVFWTQDVEGRIATVWDRDVLVAALPLRLTHAPVSRRIPLKISTLTMLHDDRVGYHDVLIRPGYEAAAARLVDLCLETGASYMDLTPLKASPGLDAFRKALGQRWQHERAEITTSFADLGAGWEAYYGKRSSNTRKNARKIDRKLEESGARLRVAEHGDSQAQEVLDGIFAVSAKSWKAVNGTDIGSQGSDRAFVTALFEQLSRRSKMRLSVLWLEDEPVAACVILFSGEKAYGLISDYDDAFAKAGVGRKITFHSIEDAATQGAIEFDMLRKTHFTQTFSDRDEALLRLRVALKPGLARWIVSGEFAARAVVEQYFGEKERLTGRRKIIGQGKITGEGK